MKPVWFLIVVILFSVSSFAKSPTEKNRIVGNIIKNALESYHYRKLQVDDEVSKKAFDEYLKRIDYSKQFFLKSDIEYLEQFKTLLDDQLVNGDFAVVTETRKILNKRLSEIEGYRKDFFAKPMNFDLDEKLELDPEKRKYLTNSEALKDHWNKTFKHSVVLRYLNLKDDQEGNGKEKGKDKKKEKKKKLLSDVELKKKSADAIKDRYKKIFSRLQKESEEEYAERLINAIAYIFDPHTDYLPPKKKEEFDIDMSGSLEGIGAVLQEDNSYIKVVKIVPGGAAWRQKELEVNDLILAVAQGDAEPVDVIDMRLDEVVRMIRGKKGTIVKLTVKKSDSSRKIVAIERDIVEVGESFAKSSVISFKDSKHKIGYIHLPKFYRDFTEGTERNCTDDVRKELEYLKKLKVDGIIFDLRNNGGGALEDARQMSGLFIKDGPIVQVKSSNGQVEVLTDNDPSITYDGPLVIMTNRFSASASEILAAAIQDYGRGVIVGGETTHGKGTVQMVFNLNQGPLMGLLGGPMGALKMTIQKFYRVSGGSTQFKGITPDIVLPDPYGYLKNREQDMPNALPWDEIAKVPYQSVGRDFDLSVLKNKSSERLKSNKRIAHVMESVQYFAKKQDETNLSIKLKDMIALDEESKKMSKEFKLDEKNENLIVEHFEDSIKSNMKIDPKEQKKWQEDLDLRKKEWVDQLQQDAILEEGINIISDMIDVTAKKGSLVKK